jgi:uncharacterized membrane protein YhhN
MTTTSVSEVPSTTAPSRAALTATGLFVLVTLVHLVAELTGPGWLEMWSQIVAMPVLALVLWSRTRAPRGRLVRWTLVGLGLSWLGDSAPNLAGEHSFIVMVGFFLLAQVAYVIAFWPFRALSIASRSSRGWPLALLAYLVVLVVLLWWCVPGAGALAGPVVVYGTVLVAMAVLSTGVHRVAAIGGALFVVSDSLIALNAFADWYSISWQGFAVMSTYLVAQAMLVYGVLAVNRLAARD